MPTLAHRHAFAQSIYPAIPRHLGLADDLKMTCRNGFKKFGREVFMKFEPPSRDSAEHGIFRSHPLVDDQILRHVRSQIESGRPGGDECPRAERNMRGGWSPDLGR